MTTAAPRAGSPPITGSRATLVAAGGALGAGARWALHEVVGASEPDGLPWALLIANVIGSAVLAWALVESRRRPERQPILIDFVGTGFCGGLTTFSALAVTTAVQMREGDAAWAAISVGVMLVAGIGAAVAVRATGRSTAKRTA